MSRSTTVEISRKGRRLLCLDNPFSDDLLGTVQGCVTDRQRTLVSETSGEPIRNRRKVLTKDLESGDLNTQK